MNKFWREFENFYCMYPKFIKNILALCAIEQATFADISKRTIDEIEKIVNKNKSVLKNSPYASIVNTNEEFKFIFGHRLLLMNLPQKFELFQNHKIEKKKTLKESAFIAVKRKPRRKLW